MPGLLGMSKFEVPNPAVETAEKAVVGLKPALAENPEVQAKVKELQNLIDKLKKQDKVRKLFISVFSVGLVSGRFY